MRKNSFVLFKFSRSSFLLILTIAALFAWNAAAAQQQNDQPLSSCMPSGSNTANGVRATCPDDTFAQPPRQLRFPPLKKDFFAPSNDSVGSQQSTNTQKPDVGIKSVIVNLPKDQATIWTSPFHIRPHDLYWLAPFAATSGVLLGSDTHSMAREQSNALAVHRSKQASNYGLAALIALPAATYRESRPGNIFQPMWSLAADSDGSSEGKFSRLIPRIPTSSSTELLARTKRSRRNPRNPGDRLLFRSIAGSTRR